VKALSPRKERQRRRQRPDLSAPGGNPSDHAPSGRFGSGALGKRGNQRRRVFRVQTTPNGWFLRKNRDLNGMLMDAAPATECGTREVTDGHTAKGGTAT